MYEEEIGMFVFGREAMEICEFCKRPLVVKLGDRIHDKSLLLRINRLRQKYNMGTVDGRTWRIKYLGQVIEVKEGCTTDDAVMVMNIEDKSLDPSYKY